MNAVSPARLPAILSPSPFTPLAAEEEDVLDEKEASGGYSYSQSGIWTPDLDEELRKLVRVHLFRFEVVAEHLCRLFKSMGPHMWTKLQQINAHSVRMRYALLDHRDQIAMRTIEWELQHGSVSPSTKRSPSPMRRSVVRS